MKNYKIKELKEGEIISLDYDLLFKKVFADNNNIERLEGLIAVWLNVPCSEVKGRVQLLNNQKPLENRKDKEQEYDVVGLVNLKAGDTILNIEINMTEGSVLLRNFTYAAGIFSKQFNNKDDYKTVSKLVQLSFDNFDINPDNPEIIKKCYLKDKTNKIIEENFEIIHIDIEKCRKLWYDKAIEEINQEDKGLILIGALLTLNKIEEFKACMEDIDMDDSVKESIIDAVEEFSQDKNLFIYYNREKEIEKIHKTDVLLAEEKGIKEGIEKGIVSRNIDIAKNMLKDNLDIDTIIKYTNLSKEEILELK